VKPPNTTNCTLDTQCPKNQVCSRGQCAWVQGSFWKYVASHELGHQVQSRAIGSLTSTTEYTYQCGEAIGGEPATDEPSLCQGQKRLCPPSERAFMVCPDDQLTLCTTNSNCVSLGQSARCVLGFCQQPRVLQDPFGVDARCRCDHVEAANGQHCLQSVEQGGPAQGEGFAQYFASKVWNDADESACAFSYYKETLLDVCPPGKVCKNMGYASMAQAAPPPTEVSCREAKRWRNTFCGMNKFADFGTELDWMTFLWNLNVTTTSKLSLQEIYGLYRSACHGDGTAPSPCRGSGIAYEAEYQRDTRTDTLVLGPDGLPVPAWDVPACNSATTDCDAKRGGIHDAALRTFGLNSARALHVETNARINGVDSNLTP
jgi:hypothetical protein